MTDDTSNRIKTEALLSLSLRHFMYTFQISIIGPLSVILFIIILAAFLLFLYASFSVFKIFAFK